MDNISSPVLQLFGCGEQGLEMPVLFGGIVTPLPTTSFFKDAMPLVTVPKETLLESLISHYQVGFNIVDFQIGQTTERKHATTEETIQFDEYNLTYYSHERQPIYALTTGHLYYFHDEKAYENLLNGAKPDPGESFLILRPSENAPEKWMKTHPGRSALLEECAYLKVEMLIDEDLKALIRRSATEQYLKELHKDIIGIEWAGSGDWESAYLQNFYLYPNWPILVDGGTQIAFTKPNPELISEQLLSMFFKVDDTWNTHFDFVKSFFKYHQRSRCLSGHPLIAKLMGYSVEAGTVDIIPLNGEGDEALYRSKYNLKTDFEYYLTQADPEYHPLAIEVDEEPQGLIVPVSSIYSMFPTPILRPDQFLTRLKINNPFSLQITLSGNIPEGVSISPISFSTQEQVVVFQVSGENAPEITDTIIGINTAGGELIFELVLKFMEFRIMPIKFWKIRDENSSHLTLMDESKLEGLVSTLNDMMGRQTNVYIDPKGLQGAFLNDFLYDGDLGDNISIRALSEMSQEIADSIQGNEIHVLFVWKAVSDINEGISGANYSSSGKRLIVINTTGDAEGNFTMATTLLHEIGHWISHAFIYPGNGETTQCSGSDKHFLHWQPDLEGCSGGDWTFYENLMVPDQPTLFISAEQAKVFSEYADKIID